MPSLRDATEFGYEPVDDPDNLPKLTNGAQDIGLYWLIDVLDDQGHILAEWCYVWWGAFYRQIMMGTVGPPGPVPRIGLDLMVVAPTSPPQILTSGFTLAVVAVPAAMSGRCAGICVAAVRVSGCQRYRDSAATVQYPHLHRESDLRRTGAGCGGMDSV